MLKLTLGFCVIASVAQAQETSQFCMPNNLAKSLFASLQGSAAALDLMQDYLAKVKADADAAKAKLTSPAKIPPSPAGAP